MIAHASMIAPGGRLSVQPRPVYVQLALQAEAEAAALVGESFGGLTGVLGRIRFPGASRFGVSRAAHGTLNPLAKIAVWMIVLRMLGLDRTRAQRFVDWLQSWVDRLWPEGEENPDRVQFEAQRDDLAEDICEAEYIAGVPGAEERWIAALHVQLASTRRLIVAMRTRTVPRA